MKINDSTVETFQYRGHIVEIRWNNATAHYSCPSLNLGTGKVRYHSERAITHAIGRTLGKAIRNREAL